jgi:hypothetical protein
MQIENHGYFKLVVMNTASGMGLSMWQVPCVVVPPPQTRSVILSQDAVACNGRTADTQHANWRTVGSSWWGRAEASKNTRVPRVSHSQETKDFPHCVMTIVVLSTANQKGTLNLSLLKKIPNENVNFHSLYVIFVGRSPNFDGWLAICWNLLFKAAIIWIYGIRCELKYRSDYQIGHNRRFGITSGTALPRSMSFVRHFYLLHLSVSHRADIYQCILYIYLYLYYSGAGIAQSV